MANMNEIMLLANIIILLTFSLLTLIQILPIILIPRFHTAPNILIGNFYPCLLLSASIWVTYYILSGFYPTVFIQSSFLRNMIPYFQVLHNCLIVHSLVMITINRYFLVMHPNKIFYKTLTWSFVSLAMQWMVSIILSIPRLLFSIQMFSSTITAPFWLVIYNMFIIFILPSIFNAFFNIKIFLKVLSSSRCVNVETSMTHLFGNSNRHNTRDIRLLKHMLFIFVVFIIGWAPIYILTIIDPDELVPLWIYMLLRILPALYFLIDVVDLFFYNHELRQYLKEKLWNCFYLNRN